MAAQIVFIAAFGLAIGSFLSVVAHRIPLGQSIITPRSRCPGCGTQIEARDNVPVFSWLALRGRCRHCGTRIAATYPLLEAGLAATFVAILLVYGDEPQLVALFCAFATTLAAITLTDLEHRLIPNKILLASAILGLALVLALDGGSLDTRAIAAGISFGALFVVAFAYPQGMGMGDVKLAGVMGLYLGKAVAPALLIGFAAGAIYGAALIARHGAEARKQAVPFGPFLALGGLVAIFVGDELVGWYTDSFFG